MSIIRCGSNTGEGCGTILSHIDEACPNCLPGFYDPRPPASGEPRCGYHDGIDASAECTCPRPPASGEPTCETLFHASRSHTYKRRDAATLESCPVCGDPETVRLVPDWPDKGLIPIVGCGNPWHYIGIEVRATPPSLEVLAAALLDVAFDLDLPPDEITAHPRWYDEPGPDEYLVFDSEQWSKDVAAALLARLSREERP